MNIRRLGAVALTLVWGCSSPATREAQPAEPTSTESSAEPSFVGKLWIASDPSAALGTMRAFLADGTLIMDSCFETYRLARWRKLDERRIEWEEDGARIEAAIARLTAEELVLRLQLGADVQEQNYRLARPPYVCPDLPR